MHDVRVLVREYEPEPVVRVADQAFATRTRRADLDQVVGNGRCPPVRKVVLADQDHLHTPRRRAEGSIQRRGDFFGYSRQADRVRFFALMEVDVEAWCGDRPESKAGIVPARPEDIAGRNGLSLDARSYYSRLIQDRRGAGNEQGAVDCVIRIGQLADAGFDAKRTAAKPIRSTPG